MGLKNIKLLVFLLVFFILIVFNVLAYSGIPYWIEHDENGNPTGKIWVKVNLTANQPLSFYVYYGSSTAPSYSDGDAVFEFFDDFDGSSLDTEKWDAVNTGHISISNSKLYMTVDSTKYEPRITSKKVWSGSDSYVGEVLISAGGSYEEGRTWQTDFYEESSSNYVGMRVHADYDGVRGIVIKEGNYTTVDSSGWNSDEWDIWSWSYTSTEQKFYRNRNLIGTLSYANVFSNFVLRIENLWYENNEDSYMYVDWVFVRKYASSEPSVSYGNEESGSWTIDGHTYTKRKKVTLTSTTDLEEYQVALDYSQFNDDKLYVSTEIFNVGINQRLNYDEFKVNHNITHVCYWQNVTVNVTTANLTLIATNLNDSVVLYNITFENITENQSVSYSYVLNVTDAHDTIQFECDYSDEFGHSAADIITKQVENTNPTKPTNISISPENVIENQNISVDISGSSDVDNDAISYYYSVYDLNASSYIYENKSESEPFALNHTQLSHDFKIEFWAYDGYNVSEKNYIYWHDLDHFIYSLENYFNVSGKKYADTIRILLKYRCGENLTFSGKDLKENNTFFNFNGTCDNEWHTYTKDYRSETEGNRTILLFMNDSYNYNYTFDYIADLIAPNISIILNNTYGFRHNITENFKVHVYDNISNLTCDIYANDINYTNQNFTNNETKTFSFNFTDGFNNWRVICYDFVNHSTTETESIKIYTKNITLINEETGERFDKWSDMYSLRFLASNYTYDFLSTNNSQIWFVTTNDDTFRLEKRYNADPSTILYIDLKPSLIPTDTPVCVAPPQQFFEIMIYSSLSKPVAVINNYAQCYVLADYTQYAYQDAVTEKIYTIKGIYYLYTYDDGQKVFLASIDGGSTYSIALDLLESQSKQYAFTLSKDDLSIQKTENSTLRIYYKNIKQDNEKVLIQIYDQNNQLVFEHEETENPNEFTIYFDYSTLNITDLLTLKITKYKISGAIEVFQRLFDKSGHVGIITPEMAILLSIVISIFTLTFVGISYAFGWFGAISLGIALAITALAPSTPALIMIQTLVAIILVFILIIWQNENSVTT